MQLQVNNSGAWKNVVSFAPHSLDDVKACATLLGIIGREHSGDVTFRVVNGEQVVCSWWHATGWTAKR